ncbi:hemicentin-1-like [Mya arenaria]|uniref:hemicentin-1-like n=1 Tax=Mya arenaria TaxID=6604 RepID=UPI0022E40962|nr:hemicentin-1-like [Mya arenaria]
MELLIYAWSVFYCINAVISSGIVSFEANTTLVEGGSAVLLKCLSHKHAFGVNFLKDNIQIGSCDIFDCQVISTTKYITSQNTSNDDFNEYYLTIKNFSKTLAGTYNCRSYETRDSKMVNLTFAAFITYVNLNPKNDPMSVIDNTIYQFECETSIGSPYATVRWFKDNKTIDDIADDIELTQLSTSSQLNEVTRSVLQLQPTKDDHGMRLFCLANNGGSDIYSSKPILDVLYGPSIPKCQFNSSVVNENISIRNGQDLTISCSAHGNPPPFLMWTYPGGTYSGPTLSFRKIAIDATGNFTCSARNTLKPTDGQEVTGSTSFTFAVNVYAPIDDVFISSPTKDVVFLQDNEELIFKCECLDGIPKATFEWFLDNATNDNKTDDKLITNDIDVSVEHQFLNGTTVSYFPYTAKSSESGMRIYCVAQNVINEITSTNSLLLAIIGIPDTPYSAQIKDVKTDAATLKWNQLYTGGLEFSVAIELRENTNEWKTHEVSEFIINDTDMRAALNNLNASTLYVLRFMVYNVLGRSMISDEMKFQTLKQNEKGTVSSSVSVALFGGMFGALLLGVALGCVASCLVVKCRRGRAPKQVLKMPTAQVKRDQESNVGDPTMYENSATTRAENFSPYAELDVHTIATSTSYEMIKHTM